MDIKRIFPLIDRHELLVHISGDSWDYQKFGPVTLAIDENSFTLEYIGFGDMKGTPVLKLKPFSNSYETIATIARIIGGTPKRLTILRNESAKEEG